MSYLPVINLWCWHGTDAFVLIHRLKLQNKQNLGTVLCIILWSYRGEKAQFLCVFRFSITMMVSANPCEMTVTQKMTVAAITMMKTMNLRMKRRCPKKNWSGTIQSKELQKNQTFSLNELGIFGFFLLVTKLKWIPPS